MKLKRVKRLTGMVVLGALTGNLAVAMNDVSARLPDVEIVVENQHREATEEEAANDEGVREVVFPVWDQTSENWNCGADRAILDNCRRAEEYASTMERRQIDFTKDSYLSPENLRKMEERRERQKRKKEKLKRERTLAEQRRKLKLEREKRERELKKKGYKTYKLPDYKGYKGFKSYEPYTAITSRDTPQWKLRVAAETDEYGLRRVDGRVCVALGSYFGTRVGQYFDLILENGTVIPCIMGDEKADRHTDDTYHIFTVHSGCCSEFIVDSGLLREYIGGSGDVSKLFRKWKSPVEKVRVYKKNYLN